MLVPNILLTNYCNQNCPFCFASKEMSNKRQNNEMSIADFKLVLKKLAKTKTNTVKLLGGEPTLHSQFKQILELSLKKFKYVQLFTNGLISQEKIDFLEQYCPRVKLTFNITTPAFIHNKATRELITKLIIKTTKQTQVTLSITLDPFFDLVTYQAKLNPEMLKRIQEVRIGVANPIAKEKNWYLFKDFPQIGKKTVKLIKSLNKKIKKGTLIHLNCGFTRCMFINKEYQYLKRNNIHILGWSCFGKVSSMDIATDKTALHCFSLSNVSRMKTYGRNLKQVNKQMIKKRFKYWNEVSLRYCKTCSYYGYSIEQCSGPCLGFLINSRSSKKFGY